MSEVDVHTNKQPTIGDQQQPPIIAATITTRFNINQLIAYNLNSDTDRAVGGSITWTAEQQQSTCAQAQPLLSLL